jgi:glycyl-tRNA synthetase alpha chain
MEVSQYTYFQQVGGLDVRPVSGELTYGLERLAMYVFGVDRVYDLPFNDPDSATPLTYGDVFLENEKQQSRFNFELSDPEQNLRWFGDAEATAKRLLEAGAVLPAFDYTLKASHLFNLLDARGVVSPTERQSFIARVRDLAKGCASAWAESQGSAP